MRRGGAWPRDASRAAQPSTNRLIETTIQGRRPGSPRNTPLPVSTMPVPAPIATEQKQQSALGATRSESHPQGRRHTVEDGHQPSFAFSPSEFPRDSVRRGTSWRPHAAFLFLFCSVLRIAERKPNVKKFLGNVFRVNLGKGRSVVARFSTGAAFSLAAIARSFSGPRLRMHLHAKNDRACSKPRMAGGKTTSARMTLMFLAV